MCFRPGALDGQCKIASHRVLLRDDIEGLSTNVRIVACLSTAPFEVNDIILRETTLSQPSGQHQTVVQVVPPTEHADQELDYADPETHKYTGHIGIPSCTASPRLTGAIPSAVTLFTDGFVCLSRGQALCTPSFPPARLRLN